MAQDLSIILVFDLKAILAGSTRDWNQFSELGKCYLPQVVLEELEFLTMRAVTDTEEKTAREFFRFLENSDWFISQGVTNHELLSSKEGENLSKNARLQLAIEQSAYYLTLEHPQSLVVVVSNQQTLREELENLGEDNLVTLTLPQFMQWLRTKQKPIKVTQKIASLGNGSMAKAPLEEDDRPINGKRSNSSPNIASSPQKAKVKPPQNNIATTIFAGFSTIFSLIIVGLFGWYLGDPQSFQKFWQENKLPFLNQQK